MQQEQMNQAVIHKKEIADQAVQVLTGVLIIYCYYQGLEKILAFNSYYFWIQHSPVIKKAAGVFAYCVPALHFLLALLLFFQKTKALALCALILMQLALFGWVAYVIYCTSFLFAPWFSPNWLQKLVEALLIAWMAAAVWWRIDKSKRRILVAK